MFRFVGLLNGRPPFLPRSSNPNREAKHACALHDASPLSCFLSPHSHSPSHAACRVEREDARDLPLSNLPNTKVDLLFYFLYNKNTIMIPSQLSRVVCSPGIIRRRVLVVQQAHHHHPPPPPPLHYSSLRRRSSFSSFSSSAAATAALDDEADHDDVTNTSNNDTPTNTSSISKSDILVEFRQARLQYPAAADQGDEAPSSNSSNKNNSNSNSNSNSNAITLPINLAITSPSLGGHALLGRNSSGKSLLGQALIARGSDAYVHDGSISIPSNWMSNAVAHVSFDSHQDLLRDGGTTARAISGGGGTLNKAAQFLIVRFGLYGLLQRDVDTLSTGEIRKTLLVKALSTRPKLLILDNAFDGLDVASREVLKELCQKTITGFTQDILVQGINSKATAHTQILMMTHRAEELVDALEHISWFDQQQHHQHHQQHHQQQQQQHGDGGLVTQGREGRSGRELLEAALDLKQGAMLAMGSYDWEDTSIPTTKAIASWWETPDTVKDAAFSSYEPIVETTNLSIQRGDATLLHDLNWTISRGQRWLVGGGNGAGKSTLSRLLARPDADSSDDHSLHINGHVGWVSTERHMEMAKSKETVRDVLTEHGTSCSMDSAVQVASWLGVDHTMDRQFCHLSQGQQKLVLVGAALASKPKLLVLDEPCQGLDGISRQQLLALVERICRATDISMVYITHHLEELIPSVSHALHLKDRRDVYKGPIDSYDPEALQNE